MKLKTPILATALLALVLVTQSPKQSNAQGSPAENQTLTQQLLAEPATQLAKAVAEKGDPARGAIAFHTPAMNCARCHVTTDGRRLGPDLAAKRDATIEHLIESVLKPSAKIHEGFETVRIAHEDGRLITAILVEETDDDLVIDSIEQAAPVTIPKDEIEEWARSKTSSMPVDLANQLAGRQSFLDLVSYLKAIVGHPELEKKLQPIEAAIAPLPEYESHVDHAGLIRSLNKESFKHGREIYQLRCASCHGTLDEEGSMPTSMRFASGKFRHGNDPLTMYNTLTHGYGMMIPQRWMVPQQKYEVIHYIREHFLKPKNKSQLFEITDNYLKTLPKGDTFGPTPVLPKPWTEMDYGPSMVNTIEVGNDGSNIAQKGITVRLDGGPGGVESGKYWLMYEHDTMRAAAAWSGRFIDWDGIHFNGKHGRHPHVTGDVAFANPTAPGFGRPGSSKDTRFKDDRVVGRDGKYYGPLDKSWVKYEGMYRYGKQTLLRYRVGDTEILESPSLKFIGQSPIYQRNLNLGDRGEDLWIQIADLKGRAEINGRTAIITDESGAGLLAYASAEGAMWTYDDNQNLRLKVPVGKALNMVISQVPINGAEQAKEFADQVIANATPQDLSSLTQGGPPNWPQKLTTQILRGKEDGPYAVDVFQRPTKQSVELPTTSDGDRLFTRRRHGDHQCLGWFGLANQWFPQQ